jgi:glycosyltransferase involved in cell wall biosynthesis
MAAARNSGIRAAAGEMVTFLDSDDWIEKDFFKDIIHYWNDDLDVCLFDFTEVFGTEKHRIRQFKRDFIDFRKNSFYNMKILRRAVLGDYSEVKGTTMSGAASACGKAYRLDFLKQNDLFFTPGVYAGEDIVFNAGCSFLTNRYQYVAIPEYNYFMNYESMSSAGYIHMGYKLVEGMSKSFDWLNRLECKPEDKAYLLQLYSTVSMKLVLWWAVEEKNNVEAKKGYTYCKERANDIIKGGLTNLGIVNCGLTLLCYFKACWILKIAIKFHKKNKKRLKVR